jgi:hypothetical protein
MGAMGRVRISMVAILLLAGVLGCGRGEEEVPPALSEAEVQRLEALGYVDWAEEPAEGVAAGAVSRNPERVHPGYNLVTLPILRRAELVDMKGEVVRSWTGAEAEHWERAVLTRDGDLLVMVGEGPRESRRRGLLRLTWDGALRWRRELPVHHHVVERSDGSLVALTRQQRWLPGLAPQTRLMDNGVAVLSPEGEILDERSLHDMLAARPDLFTFLPIESGPEGPVPDFLHANFLHWMGRPALADRDPLYAPSNALITIRNQDTIAIFDFEKGELVWAWGQGELLRPHDATVLDDGHILVFDNRLGEGVSRIVELDPLSREIVWEYPQGGAPGFYSGTRGTVQRLPNGNTLMGESNRGRALEVTPGGEIVWEYRTPHRNEKGQPAALRIERYSPSEIPALAASSGREEAELERLSALGYVDFSQEPVDPDRSGLTVLDEKRSHPGYTLYTVWALCRAELVDWRGRVVNSWRQDTPGRWERALLRPDGGLMIVGAEHATDASGEVVGVERFLERRTWGGDRVWRVDLPVHHDVAPTPDGRWSVLTRRLRRIPAISAEVPVQDDGVAIVSEDGRIIEERSLHDLLTSGATPFRFKRLEPRRMKAVFADLLDPAHAPESLEKGFVDLIHANSLQWIDLPGAGAREPGSQGHLLVTMRSQDTVAVFDWDARELIWSWGSGELIQPHNASLLPSGNFLIFDNRRGQGWSRVIELDPRSKRVVWEYRAADPKDFYSATRGAAQRLANGNTLIADSDSGRGFEVTPEGDLVWEFQVPHADREGRRATIVRMVRYEEDFVRGILEGEGGG